MVLCRIFIDLDECRHNPCGAGAQCTNTKGGYTCSCPRGYQGNPTPEAGCVDIDECWGPKPPCGKGAQCVNTNGGYYCQCPEGYTGNPTSGCVGKLTSIMFMILKIFCQLKSLLNFSAKFLWSNIIFPFL